MTPRIYSNIAVQTSLVSGITAAATSLTVADATGYPAAPFAIVVDPGSATYEEVMLVTAKAGAVFTATRAYDGTTAKVHAAGALVIHAAIADDFRGMQLGTRDVSSVAPGASDILTWNNGLAQWEPGAAPASGVTAVTATAPLQSSGGVTPDISIASQAANLVLAGPAAGVAAAPTFRALVAADLPSISSGLTGVLPPANGGTGVNNGANLLTVPATGTAALLGTQQTFTAKHDTALGSTTLTTFDQITATQTDPTANTYIGTNLSYTISLSGVPSALSSYIGSAISISTGAQAFHANSGIRALQFAVTHANAWTLKEVYGIQSDVRASLSGATITNIYTYYALFRASVSGAAVSVGTNFYADSPVVAAGASVTIAYGLRINQQKVTGVGTGYGIAQLGTTDINDLRGPVIINEDGIATVDVRIEGDTQQNLFFSDASADRIGIGTNAPNSLLDVAGALQCDSLRVDVTPTAETPTATHTVVINFNGTSYKVPCLAA